MELNFLEIAGLSAGLLYLFFQYKENILLWPLGIITSGVYTVVFFMSGIYADMAINVYYVLISFYGWYVWKFKGKGPGGHKHISRTPKVAGMALFFGFLALFAFGAWFLNKYTDTNVAVPDAFTTSLSIVATYLLAKKYIEHWILWVVVDAVSVALYIYKELYFTSFLFLIYTIVSVFGYFEWKRRMHAA